MHGPRSYWVNPEITHLAEVAKSPSTLKMCIANAPNKLLGAKSGPKGKNFSGISNQLTKRGLYRIWSITKSTGIKTSFEKLDSPTEFRKWAQCLFS
jgi:hypothetical protein